MRYPLIKYSFCLFFISIVTLLSKAQVPFGNEWINKNQKYLKIKVSENGIYRINFNQLQSLGFLQGSSNPQNFQLFFRGQEIPIFISGAADLSFDNGDYIEFYGIKNDGKLDEILYSTNHQPNTEVSLFSDEATYFLTVGTTAGRRYTTPNLTTDPISPEPFLIYTASANFAEVYYPGAFLLDAMSLSEYVEGEGYLGNTFALGATQSRTIATPFQTVTASFTPKLSYYVAGRSNALATNPNAFNHHLKINVGTDILTDTVYRGYSIARGVKSISSSNITNNTIVNFASVNDLGAVTDFQAPAYVRITYARSFDGSSITLLPFQLTTNSVENLLRFTNTSWTQAYLLDPSTGYRYSGTKSNTVTEFKIKNPTNNQLIVYDESAVKTAAVEAVNWNLIDAPNFASNLVIITHQSLLESANEYAAYKTQKGFQPIVVTTEQIYNQFYYGQHHPLAIKNLLKYLFASASKKPEYLLLIGKGYENPKANLAADLVPTMGYPASDTYLTSEIVNNSAAPALATGRIPARTNDDVRNYLNKLKDFDVQPDSIWRKRIINVSGANNASENASFANYLKSFSAISSQPSFGSETISYFKSVTDPITDNLAEKISNDINKGAALLSYLGHGSTSNTAITIGSSTYLSNKDKLLFYLVNGCSTGNAFTSGSMGEDYILRANQGAIGWIGTSSEGVASYLSNYTSLFYQNAFSSNFGKSVAYNLGRAAASYQNNNDNLNLAHLKQYIYLGDPTISFYAPSKPDFEITPQDLSMVTAGVTANSTAFQIRIIAKNRGKAVNGSLPVAIRRTLADNSFIDYPLKNFNNLFHTDTLIVDIDNNIANAAGNNRFSVVLDPSQTFDELSEQNNTAEFSYYFPSNGLTPIQPYPYAIVNTSDVELKAQSNNPFVNALRYSFEIDTLATFNSSWKKNAEITGNQFGTWRPNQILEQNKVYYWRVKTNSSNPQNDVWQHSSFTYIANSQPGWNQGHYQQFDNIALQNIVTTANGFQYAPTYFPVLIRTRGNQASTNTDRRTRVSASSGSSSFYTAEFRGVSLLALNATNPNQTVNYPSPLNQGIYGYGQFYFDTNNPAQLDSLLSYLNQIPNGYYVTGMSGVDFNPQNLPQPIKNAFSALGLTQIFSIQNGEPYAFWTKKGGNFAVVEKTANYALAIPANQQAIEYTYQFEMPGNNGIYTSEKLGPASKWSDVAFNFSSENTNELKYDIIGVSQSGHETVLKQDLTTPNFSLGDIQATSYPYLKLRVNTLDTVHSTIPVLKNWRVHYDGYPDISFNASVANTFHAESVQEGDSVRLSIGVSNLNVIASDSVMINYRLTKNDRSITGGSIKTIKPLLIADPYKLDFKLPTLGLVGANVLQLYAQPKDQRDLYEFNNYATYNFQVKADQKAPMVDVLFDEKRIINGEIVSPTPRIHIDVNDENTFRLLNDTTAAEIYLKQKSEANFRRVAFSDNKIAVQQTGNSNKNTITFLYQPDVLKDGQYELKVRSKDASGNYITASDYVISFEVINEQTVTNFLPYPNPFTTSMRFVFQVTGKIPENIKVQIMTVTGKIVREVFQHDLGPIKIGNNISAFSWDGTDQYGDRLANGIYFYQVTVIDSDQNQVKHRSNASDAYFKKNFGKIYLMR